jgi:ATP-dependent Clp protease ATP-binding subunit ClpB
MLAQRHRRLEVTPEAKALLAEEGYDPVFGARPLKRVIQQQLQNPIALELLEGTFQEGDTIRVVRDGERLRFERIPGTGAEAGEGEDRGRRPAAAPGAAVGA